MKLDNLNKMEESQKTLRSLTLSKWNQQPEKKNYDEYRMNFFNHSQITQNLLSLLENPTKHIKS